MNLETAELNLNELDRLAFEFFKLFAQYEYALKAMGYGRSRNGHAEADWDRFANEVGAQVLRLETPDVKEACDYLFRTPPKRQVWADAGHVDWATVTSQDRSAQTLFAHLRRVRNNLYHGGKFNGRWIDPDRSRELIGSSLGILRALTELDSRVAEAIEQNRLE